MRLEQINYSPRESAAVAPGLSTLMLGSHVVHHLNLGRQHSNIMLISNAASGNAFFLELFGHTGVSIGPVVRKTIYRGGLIHSFGSCMKQKNKEANKNRTTFRV